MATEDDLPETFNRFLVGVQGPSVVFLRPLPRQMSKPEALLLAAWLVALADDGDDGFDRVLKAVRST